MSPSLRKSSKSVKSRLIACFVKLEKLKLLEQCGFEEVVDADLRRGGYQSHPELKLASKIQLISSSSRMPRRKKNTQGGVSAVQWGHLEVLQVGVNKP
jgi:hypothetical protein